MQDHDARLFAGYEKAAHLAYEIGHLFSDDLESGEPIDLFLAPHYPSLRNAHSGAVRLAKFLGDAVKQENLKPSGYVEGTLTIHTHELAALMQHLDAMFACKASDYDLETNPDADTAHENAPKV